MDEYISRQEAINALYEVYEHEYPTASGDFDEYARHDVRNVLNGLPAADVQPVKHGIWLDNPNQSQLYSYICSNCRNSCDWTYRYCPNCGSKNRMDGDGDDQS